MIGLYVSLGIDSFDATAGVLLYRGIHYLLVLALGLPAFVLCEAATGKLRSSTTELAEEAPPGSERPPGESPPDSPG